MNKIAGWLVLIMLAALALALPGAGVAAAQTGAAAPAAKDPGDAVELEAFLDELMARDMEEQHIAGAVVAVVKDGELVLAKGYGYADLEKGIPVDAAETGFLIGSVTKLFTWTAVMQLVEQGRLDLDADVNSYLDFRIPDTYPQAITLRHLLTHTPGFEESFFEVLARDSADLRPAGEWLASHIPARVRPPGEVAAYSNYGTALAGYIVARQSGEAYGDYIQKHIFDPLGMVHSTAQTTIPPHLRAGATVGYTYVDGALQPFGDYLGQGAMVPAGGILASATDMARFMIAHLQGGRYGDANTAGVHILREETARQMQQTLYTPDSRLLGTAYGFFDFSDNGQRALGHGGESYPIQSLLLLLPGEKLGIFVSYNSEGGGNLTNQHFGFQRAFFDHYYPAPPVEPVAPPADFAERAGRFSGSYRVTRNAYTTFEKTAGLMTEFKVADGGDGTLLLSTPYGDWRLVEVGPLYFRMTDAPYGFAFREDAQGRITHLFSDITPMQAYEKVSWYEAAGFHQGLALASVLLFLSVIPVAAIGVIASLRRRGSDKPAARGARAAQGLIVGTAVLYLLFLAGILPWLMSLVGPRFGVPILYQIVLGAGVVSAVLTPGALAATALAWRNGYWGVARRGYYTALAVAAVAFVWFLNYWNLLGWRF
jgi:CubicO group peptidase (beta-lactamase class C family)